MCRKYSSLVALSSAQQQQHRFSTCYHTHKNMQAKETTILYMQCVSVLCAFCVGNRIERQPTRGQTNEFETINFI